MSDNATREQRNLCITRFLRLECVPQCIGTEAGIVDGYKLTPQGALYSADSLQYPNDWNLLLALVVEIGSRTGHWLNIGSGSSYFVQVGEFEEYPYDCSWGYDSCKEVYNLVTDMLIWLEETDPNLFNNTKYKY